MRYINSRFTYLLTYLLDLIYTNTAPTTLLHADLLDYDSV